MSGGASAVAIGSLAAGALSAGVGAIGAIKQGNAAADAAKYNATIAQQNQAQALDNASRVAATGDQNAAIQQQKTRAQAGAIKAQQAASGIDVNSGSAVDVQSSAAELGELDAITVRSKAAQEAYGFQTQATGLQNQSTLDTAEAANDQSAGLMNGITTFLGGAGSAGSNYASFLQKNSGITA